SRAWPSGVIRAVLFSAGGRQRPMRACLVLAAEDAAQQAAHDLVAQLGADGAGGLLGHRLDHALATLGAEHGVLHRLAEAAGIRVVLRGLRRRRLGGLRRRFGAPGEHFRSGITVDRVVVLGTDGAAVAYLLALGFVDGAHATARRRDQGL